MEEEMKDPVNARYEAAAAQAQQSIEAGDYDTARAHLMRAHAAGHDSRMCHVKAHAALLRLAWRRRSPVEMTSQLGLLVLAAIFG